jgi:hypothetical protein
MDTATDSERFYNSLLDLFEDVDEMEEVNNLLTWWNWYVHKILPFHWAFVDYHLPSQIFPAYSGAR